MASSGLSIKALFIPFVISLLLFSLVTFVLVPAWRRYRARYAQYLPIDSISQHTSGLRSRITSRLTGLFVPWSWRREVAHGGDGDVVFASGRPSAESAVTEEGEELDEVDEDMLRAIERHRQTYRQDHERRLSRDLEEGFRDDSDEDSDR